MDDLPRINPEIEAGARGDGRPPQNKSRGICSPIPPPREGDGGPIERRRWVYVMPVYIYPENRWDISS